MLKQTLPVLLSFSLGCVQPQVNLTDYYDLDQLLEQQVEQLENGKYRIQKQVTIGGESETKTFEPDSMGWVEQFAILMDFSPNNPKYVGAFEIEKNHQEQVYRVKENQKTPLKYFSVKREGVTSFISAELHDNKTIYIDHKEVSIELQDGRMISYKVSGYQKMVLKDTIHYMIGAQILAQ